MNLDGYLFSDAWTNGWKAQIVSRLAPDFSSWQEYVRFDCKQGEERADAHKALRQKDREIFTRFQEGKQNVVRALYIGAVEDGQGD